MLRSERVSGHPYEGNMNEGAKKHIFDVTSRWLAPDGDISKGIDGFRLDVADQIPMGFWRDYRTYVKSVNPEAYLVGEIWWEKWPDTFMDPSEYANPEIFDAVMFYQAYRPARGFFAQAEPHCRCKTTGRQSYKRVEQTGGTFSLLNDECKRNPR